MFIATINLVAIFKNEKKEKIMDEKNQEAFFDFYVIPFICFITTFYCMFAHRKNTDKKREHLYYNWIPFWS